MTKEELKAKIAAEIPAAAFDESGEWLNIEIEKSTLPVVTQLLRNDPELWFDFLFCLTCIDWKTHLTMVYHFTSTRHRHALVIKSKLDRSDPQIETLSDTWRTAELHEREVFDLFGVKFLHHPDMRRIILTDDWVGFPLRKDYEDPVNMIKL
jgi:NADH-quinone oxidoreductase subunit C